MTAAVIPLRKPAPPAYTPMGPPVQCQTPGHEDISRYPARPRPGGRLCDKCAEASRAAMNRSDEKGAVA